MISSVTHSVLLLLLVVVVLVVVMVLMLRTLRRSRRRRLPISALHACKLLKAALLQRTQNIAHGERRGVFRAQGHDLAPARKDEYVFALRQPDTTIEKKIPSVMTVMAL